MSTTTRTLAGVGAGLTALLLTVSGPAAFAALPVPDPTTVYNGGNDRGDPQGLSVTQPVEHHTAATASGISTWMLLLIITTAIVLALLMVEGLRRTRARRPAVA